MISKEWEIYISNLVKNKKTGFVTYLLKKGLHSLSFGFRLAVACRNWAFDQKWLKQHYIPAPVVISVGNIVAGGTGKTPTTLMIAKEFYKEFPTAILSRGYKSPAEKQSSPIALSNGNGPLYPASFCGDEPYLLSLNLPEAFLFVGKNRREASNMAVKAGAQLILLDDGMQHRYLARDFEIIVVNALDPFGQGHFLPRGFLREEQSSLARANMIVINHVRNAEHFHILKEEINVYSKAPLVGVKPEVVKICDFSGNAISTIEGKRTGLFCSIANPENFQNSVKSQGGIVVASYFLSDHEGFNKKKLEHFANECRSKGAELLICTEKDKVKFTSPLNLSLPVAWLQIQLSIIEGNENWVTFIEKIKQDIIHKT